MAQISEEYRMGIEQIDEEHARLLELTEKAKDLLDDQNMLFKCADIRVILAGLRKYMLTHFSNEEAYMEGLGYDKLDAHRKQHRVFEEKLREFTEEVDRLSLGTQDGMIQELFEYLQNWLQGHIKIEDRKYVGFGEGKTENVD